MASINANTKQVAQPVPSYLPQSTLESATSKSSLLPGYTTSVFNAYVASVPSSITVNVTTSNVEYKTSLDPNDPNNPFHIAHVTQAKIDAAVLSVIGQALAMTSGIITIAASSLSIIKESLGFLPAEWGIIEKPLQLDVALTSFGISLFNDGLKYNTGADLLGKEAKLVAMWESVKGQVLSKNNTITSSYENVIAQIAKAKAIIGPLEKFYAKQ